MKRFWTIISASVFAVVLASCSKEPAADGSGNGGNVNPEPESVTVSLVKSASAPGEFELSQSEDGTVTGTVEFSFVAELSGASDKDVTVSFEASCEGISSEKISLDRKSVVIDAGKTSSEEVTVKVTDWSELSSVSEAGEYTLTVGISGTSAEVSQSASEVSVTVVKPARPESSDVTVGLTEPSKTSFNLSHTADGVSGNVTFTVSAMLSEASSEDVTLVLEAECEGISADNIVLSSSEVTVTAGRILSDEVTVSIPDLSVFASEESAAEYTLTVGIKEASVEVDPVNSSVSVKISKSALGEVSFPEFGSGFLSISSSIDLMGAGYRMSQDAKDWSFEFWTTGGAELENPVDNTVTGTGTSDVACNNDLINFIVDFNAEKTLGGMYFQHWGSLYCPTSIRLSVSKDGKDWVEMGTVSSSPQVHVAFAEPVVTRYLKYEMLGITGDRVDIMYVYLWEK